MKQKLISKLPTGSKLDSYRSVPLSMMNSQPDAQGLSLSSKIPNGLSPRAVG